jgi:hypothetical protein
MKECMLVHSGGEISCPLLLVSSWWPHINFAMERLFRSGMISGIWVSTSLDFLSWSHLHGRKFVLWNNLSLGRIIDPFFAYLPDCRWSNDSIEEWDCGSSA